MVSVMTRTSTKTLVTTSLSVAVFAAALAGCTKSGAPQLSPEPNVELIQDMMEQPALKPQDFDPINREQGIVRLPPEGTVPVGYKPYPYHLDPEKADASLKNPYADKATPEILEVGRKKFETYCAVCHGYEGKGDGPVSPKMALKPPPLVSDKVVGYKDARIFHIITDGQGVMSSYAQQLVDENDRWAIVNYVRSLQRLSKK